jgi:[ribosomal protein S18]-alanine N-acetyltransferase
MSPFPTGGDAAALVRTARRDDLSSLVALENAAFSVDRLSRRSFARLIAAPSALVLVAELNGRLAGAAVVLLRSYSSRARLYSLAVAPHVTGAGIGSKLLGAAEDAAAERGATVLTLEVREDNAAALGLYTRRGFEATGRTDAYYGDGAAAVHLHKRLQAYAARSGAAA